MGIIPSRLRRVKTTYRLLIVRPLGEFQPTNWRQRPAAFEIVRVWIDSTPLLGVIDAKRFIHNKDLIDGESGFAQWAILETFTEKLCQCGGVLVDMSTTDMMPSPQSPGC